MDSPMLTTRGWCFEREEETRSTISTSLRGTPAASSCSSAKRTRSRSSRKTRAWDCLGAEGLRTARGRAEQGEGRLKRFVGGLGAMTSFEASSSIMGAARATSFDVGEQHMANY